MTHQRDGEREGANETPLPLAKKGSAPGLITIVNLMVRAGGERMGLRVLRNEIGEADAEGYSPLFFSSDAERK